MAMARRSPEREAEVSRCEWPRRITNAGEQEGDPGDERRKQSGGQEEDPRCHSLPVLKDTGAEETRREYGQRRLGQTDRRHRPDDQSL